ncbi:response regulator transcription factor [Dokdonella sp.]|uniref:helix-turn-helix transcriptional regulator n=1 Tax=Dokdonella sp. TaxID=2291710 RepID=UPI002638A8C7|nr:response regulator transcription factor [Dokdonella sp.]
MKGFARNGRPAWLRMVGYGVFLAAGTLALQWLDYQRLARVHAGGIYVGLVALAFLALGVYVGARLFAPARPKPFDGNPQAQAALGISSRELDVLREIAAGHSNKEIAARLYVSPNTVKTHLAQLYAKLGAKRRTDALCKAREAGLLP